MNREYTAVIRTLGTAGEKYRVLLESLSFQALPPKEVIVYIADGCALPTERADNLHYVYVKKGMVAQRALPYNEVHTPYCLFLDDDLDLPPQLVSSMFLSLERNQADVISPDIYSNSERDFDTKLRMAFLGKSVTRSHDNVWGYKVLRNGGYSYNIRLEKDVYLSQTNAGACFLCTKETFLSIRFDEEEWLDEVPYALGDDEVMFYKMYKKGYKILTMFRSGIRHLDAGGSERMSAEKQQQVLYADFRFKYVFWHRFIYLPEKSKILRLWDAVCICYPILAQSFMSLIRRNDNWKIIRRAVRQAKAFIKSEAYKSLPLVSEEKHKIKQV
jgi:hypothetical protein